MCKCFMFRNILQVQLKLTKGRSKGASEVATARVRPSRRAAESLISESGRDAAGSATQSSALPLGASSPRDQGLAALIPVFAGHGAAGWYRSRAQLMVTRRLGFARARRLACGPAAAGAGPATRWTSIGGSGSESLNGDSDLDSPCMFGNIWIRVAQGTLGSTGPGQPGRRGSSFWGATGSASAAPRP